MPLLHRTSRYIPSAVAAMLLLGGCSSEPHTYSLSVDAVKTKLTGAQEKYIEGGQNTRTVRATGWSGDTLNVEISTSVGEKYTQRCTALVQGLDDDTTRVIPECGNGMNAGHEAILQTLEIEVDEFVIAVLGGGEMDGKRILTRAAAANTGNMNEMRNEALQADIQVRQNGGSFEPAPQDWASDNAGDGASQDGGWGDS